MKITYAKNSLRSALADASPVLAQTAVVQAEKMLAAIESQCLEQLDVLLAELTLVPGEDAATRGKQIRSAYDTARRMIGIGTAARFPAMDTAAKSLCEVADGLSVRNMTDWAPVRVHIDTMRLLRQPNMPQAATEQLLAGLEAVRGRFAVKAQADKRTADQAS
jgi:hypothetical protein